MNDLYIVGTLAITIVVLFALIKNYDVEVKVTNWVKIVLRGIKNK